MRRCGFRVGSDSSRQIIQFKRAAGAFNHIKRAAGAINQFKRAAGAFNKMKHILPLLTFAIFFAACTGNKRAETATAQNALPAFSPDSAMACVVAQCDFGARVPGSEAHRLCGDYIAARFAAYGLTVSEQTADLKAWDGNTLPMRNIIASLNPGAEGRILVTAHWDSRPWSDNDPNAANHTTPVLAANDGASGVAVMVELARVLAAYCRDSVQCGGIAAGEWGVDFVCFDCEDYGKTHSDDEATDETWAMGSNYWSLNPHRSGYTAGWGVNLDMVGGRGSVFRPEGFSRHYAPHIVWRLWDRAVQLGLARFFPTNDRGYIIDDHVGPNRNLHIPTVDIIGCENDNHPSTWHTVTDTPQNIDPAVMAAVGKVLLSMIINQ